MKILTFLLFIFISVTIAFSQKKNYFLIAYAQRDINLVCGTKVMINNTEVSLNTEEAKEYRNKYKAQIEKQYNSKNGYKNLFVELFYPGNVVILYEGEKKYEQRRDGWDCTSTYYSTVKGMDDLTVDNQLAKIKSEYKYTTFGTVKRWGKPTLQSDKTDDLEVRWATTTDAVITFITNTRKDEALKVTIKSYKAAGANLAIEGGFNKAKIVETYTTVLQPGDRLQKKFDNADGFEIDTAPAKIIKEQQGVINSLKPLMRRYLVNPNGKIISTGDIGIGVRG